LHNLQHDQIYWDDLGLDHPNSGIGYYGAQLFRSLETLGTKPRRISSFTSAPWLRSFLSSEASFYRCIRETNQSKAIFHSHSNFNLPQILPKRTNIAEILTVHDLIPLTHPQLVSNSAALRFRLMFPRAIRRAELIICVSNHTQSALLSRFPSTANKVHVIPHGGDFIDQQLYQSIRHNKVSPARRYQKKIISIGRYEPYKRFELLIDALKEAQSTSLSIVTNDIGIKVLEAYGAKYLATGQLKLLSNLGDPEYFAEIASADALACPSLIEGFCLPVLQALQFEKPVVFVEGHAMDEWVPPESSLGLSQHLLASDWGAAIQDITNSASNKLSAADDRGCIKTLPTWNQAAKKLIKMYNNLLR
jgi:glycosyltransferase involved in cell wall biosynthesis